MIRTEPRLSITYARASAQRVPVVAGAIDLDGAPRLARVLQHAGVRPEPVAIDLFDARFDGAAGTALLVSREARSAARLGSCLPA